MMSDAPADDRQWERGWEGHFNAQLRRLARLPLGAKLEWLEQAHRVVRHLESQRAVEARSRPSHESS